MPVARRAVIGLGGNLGDRRAYLERALVGLAARATLLARSRLYETAPWGDVPQGPYLNAAALLAWPGSPAELLAVCVALEREAGRVRGERYGPRTLDLDVLWIEGLAHRAPELEVPHPRLAERSFALLPLLDVAPDARDPRTGAPYSRPAPDGVLGVIDW